MMIYIGVSAIIAHGNPSLLLTPWHNRVADSVFFQCLALFISDFTYLGFVYFVLFVEAMMKLMHQIRYLKRHPGASYKEYMECTEYIVTGLIGLGFCYFSFICVSIICKDWKRRAERNRMLTLIEGKDVDFTTWSEIKDQFEKDEGPPECTFCLGDYEDSDEVVQLECHKSHVFHRACFKTFLKNIVEKNTGQARCPLCQSDIRYQT